jgi:hypothetical protein
MVIPKPLDIKFTTTSRHVMQQYSLTRIKERKVNLQNYKEADRRQTCKQLQYLV